jgi:hypothetical protein
MTAVQDCKYSHDVAVASITSYYTFLERIHPDEVSKFEYPPPTGWPQFKRELFPGCIDAVVELLRHIPYTGVGLERMDATQVIGHDFHANNLLRDDLDQKVQSKDLGAKRYTLDFELPPHVVPLTDGSRYGYGLLVDTEQGTIIMTKNDNEYATGIHWDGTCYLDYHPEEGEDDDDDEIDEGGPWRWKLAPAYAIKNSSRCAKSSSRI